MRNVRTQNVIMVAVSILVFLLSNSLLLGQEACLECHGETDFSTVNDLGEEVSLYVDGQRFANSIHGDFSCTDCHFDAEEKEHPDEHLKKVDCSVCHDDAAAEFERGIHFKAIEQGINEAPSCVDCHEKHYIVSTSNPNSKVYPLNLAATCAVCHSNPQIVKKYDIPIPNPTASYEQSVHGVAVLSEHNFDAATCTSCHNSHDIRTLTDPESPIYWRNIPETCGQCHGEVFVDYTESIHWKAALKGVRGSPVCTDCHGEHSVKSPDDPKAPVHPLRVSAATCERCHAAEGIASKYGIPEDRASTFENSYHGLAIKGGSLAAANCASCHGIHNILPSSDPRSLVHPANLRKTCGACHNDLTENVLKGAVHLTTSTSPGRIVQTVKNIYLLLIVLVIGGMIIHNSADFIKKSKQKIKTRVEE